MCLVQGHGEAFINLCQHIAAVLGWLGSDPRNQSLSKLTVVWLRNRRAYDFEMVFPVSHAPSTSANLQLGATSSMLSRLQLWLSCQRCLLHTSLSRPGRS